MKQKNTIHFQQAAGHNQAEVHFHQGEKVPVCVAILVDITASREATIEFFKETFEMQMGNLQEKISQLSSVESVKVILCTYTGKQIYLGHPIDVSEVSNALSQVQCVGGLTNICGTLEALQDRKNQFPKIHGVIVIGDTADGDSKENLRRIGLKFGAPIVTLVDRTNGEVGTKDIDITKMQILSEASGVTGCPNDAYDTSLTFSQQALDIMLASAGPVVLQEARDRGIIKPTNPIHDLLLDKIASPLPKWRRIQLPSLKRVGLGLGVATAAISTLWCAISNRQTQKAPEQPPLVPIVQKETPAVFQMPQLFDNGSSIIGKGNEEALREWVQQLRQRNCTSLTITGHASSDGSARRNQIISEKRADAVADFVRANGIDVPVRAVGMGETQAKTPPDPADRRVEVECGWAGPP